MAGNYHHSTLPASQSAATSHDLVKADKIEDIVAPALRFPFSGTYSSQLEIPEDEDPPVYHSTAILAPAIMETHQGATTAPSYLSITRPWDQQLPIQQRTKPANSGQTQAQLAVWECQAPIEEPFNNIWKVAKEPAHCQQDMPYKQAGNLRRKGRKKCHSF